MPEDEVRQLLQVTVIIGVLLITLLLGCYICVFRKLCCISDESSPSRDLGSGSGASGGGGGAWCSRLSYKYSRRRSFGGRSSRKGSICMGELTHVSSQPTETEVL